MNRYGFPLKDYANKPEPCIDLLANYLNRNSLSLLLGAGASSGFGLPGWSDLVISCAQKVDTDFTLKASYSNAELKSLMDIVKKKASDKYIQLIKNELYQNVEFNFTLAKKDLLTAITSLLIGKTRGSIKNILTLNFDNVLEWYLHMNGLSTNIATFQSLIFSTKDVDILHIHGYIPAEDEEGLTSTEVVFSKKEFEDRQIGDSYWKDTMYEFFRRNVFLSIGLSPQSLKDDICPYLRYLNTWYDRQGVRRKQPYGFAFITPGDDANSSIDDLLEDGIIPCTLPIPDFAPNIFSIAQNAVKKTQVKTSY